MPALAPQRLPYRGSLQPVYSPAAVGGHTVTNYGNVILHIRNESLAAVTVTVGRNVTCRSPGVEDDASFIVPAESEAVMGPFPSGDFDAFANAEAEDTNKWIDQIAVNYSATADVYVAAIALSMHATTEARYE